MALSGQEEPIFDAHLEDMWIEFCEWCEEEGIDPNSNFGEQLWEEWPRSF